tara:strand:- start:10 stop:384 length:375 start_codon:yes stop_codon:yes gene_type:complete
LKITIPISVGELLDKISILQIKSQHTDNIYVTKELESLIEIAKQFEVFDFKYFDQLFEVNHKLWKIEDKLRALEKSQDFGDTFINLARSVYITNDRRSLIKKEINEKYNSSYREVKIHIYKNEG